MIQKDKSHDVSSKKKLDGHHPEEQLIAEAIAAYQSNNAIYKSNDQKELINKTQNLFGLTMLGTCPTFYKIPISFELSNHVSKGKFYNKPTIVEKFIVYKRTFDKPSIILNKGYREKILKCFLAFLNML